MKTKKASSALITFKVLIVLQVITVFLIAFSSCGRNKNPEETLSGISLPPAPPTPPKPPTMEGSDTIWQIVDEIPLLPGGEELLMKYISKNIRYPEAAKEKGIQGRVFVKFFISSRGDVSGHVIVKSVSPELDAEALRVVKTLTKFEPARRDRKAVPAWYNVPITFVLR
jgi:TonB family protein